MADNGGTVGRLNVEIAANTLPLQAGLKQAEAQTAATGTKIAANLGGTVAGRGGFLDSIGTGIKSSTAGLRSAVGAVTAVVGVASRLLGIVGLITSGVYIVNSVLGGIGGKMGDSADEADRMKKNLADAEDVGKRLAKELEDANKQLGDVALNPQAIDPVAFNKAKSDVTNKATDIARGEAFLRSVPGLLRDADSPEERRAIRARAAAVQDALVVWRQQLADLEAVLNNLMHGRDEALKRIIEAATAKILALQKEQTNKLLESIAIDSARARQVAEEMQSSQHRGP